MRSKSGGATCINTTIRLYVARVKPPAASSPPGGRTIPFVNDVIIVLLVILVIVVIIRGPKTIPQIGRMFGQGVREAREEINKVRNDDDASDDAPANTTAGGGTTSA